MFPFVSRNICCTSNYKFWIILLWGRPRKQLSLLTFISVPSHFHLAALIYHRIPQQCLNTLKETLHFLQSQRSGTESLHKMFCFLRLHVYLDFCCSHVYVFMHFKFFPKTKYVYPFFIFVVHRLLLVYPPPLKSLYLFLILLFSIFLLIFLCSSHPSLHAHIVCSHAPWLGLFQVFVSMYRFVPLLRSDWGV